MNDDEVHYGIFCRRHADQWAAGTPLDPDCYPESSWRGGTGGLRFCSAKDAAGSTLSAGTTSGQAEGGQREPQASSAPSADTACDASNTEWS